MTHKITDEQYEAMVKEGFKFDIKILDYPFNIRTSMVIKTNFGQISYTFDYAPSRMDNLGECLKSCLDSLVAELYVTHRNRGGKHVGEEGWKEWCDKNEPTIIEKPSLLSPMVKSNE